MNLTNEQLFKLIKGADPRAARIPPGIRKIADAIFEAAQSLAVTEPIGWRQRWPHSSVDPNRWSAHFDDDPAYCRAMILEFEARGAVVEPIYRSTV